MTGATVTLLGSQMPHHLIGDVHEWINQIPTVLIHCPVKPQPKGTGLGKSAGKEDPDELDSGPTL